MAKNSIQRKQHGSMLVRRIFGIFDEVTATLKSKKGDQYEPTYVELIVKGLSGRVLFYPDQVKWKFTKPRHDPRYGKCGYKNTASETIDNLVSNIVKHTKEW